MEYIFLIPFIPLLAFLLLGLFGRKYIGNASGIIGVLSSLAGTVLALYAAYEYFFLAGKTGGAYQPLEVLKITWLAFSPSLSIDMGILADPISIMMIVVVTFVSLMVNIYSVGYMKGESRYSTYFAFLSLFSFSMLGLVLSTNIFQIYIFWELVGLSSYLLIGFYYDKASAVAAAKKAFIVTRFADLGFLIGILVLGFYANTFDFVLLIDRLTQADSVPLASITADSFIGISALGWALALVFMGGAGKSAMFPLHIWLPDAMEGPTPVSALIHAATMVVAGVFLVARLFPVYALSAPQVLTFIGYVGAISAIIAALIACTQTDIKRVLAYSTMSQIGYMMFALGVSGVSGESGLGFTASMFHLFTHAFFKALLFLTAGTIIHAVHSNDINNMGSLRRFMPITHICFLLACLSISGIPPFSGFFSKEEILTAAFRSDKLIYSIALLTAGITSFYMFRLYFLVFWNKPYENGSVHGEGDLFMKIPMMILAACSVCAGFIPFGNFITSDGLPHHAPLELTAALIPVLVAFAGILIAYSMYAKPKAIADGKKNLLYQSLYHKLYIDELYLFITRKIIFNAVAKPSAWFDRNIVDGTLNSMAIVTAKFSRAIKKFQSGKVQDYALYFFAAVIGLAVMMIYWFK